MLVSDLLNYSASLAKVIDLSSGEALTASEQALAFQTLQFMMDAWQTDRPVIFGVVNTLFNLVSGQQVYTIGPGGNFDVPRPLWIQDAGIVSNDNPEQPLELQMAILNDDEWAALSIKNVPSSLSWYLWYSYAYAAPTGLGSISFWPIPNVGNLQVRLYLPTPLPNFTSVSETLFVPPGYTEALAYNLAVRLSIPFGVQVDPSVAALASESFTRIQRANKRIQLLVCDESLLGGSGRRIFNWIIGSSSPVAGGW